MLRWLQNKVLNKINVVKYLSTDNLRDLCDTLISCENEAKQENGNEIMKKLDEYHYINILSDVVFGE